jgi:hypothetical protein
MATPTQKFWISLLLLTFIPLPIIGSFLRTGGLPVNFGQFPPQQSPFPEPPLNWLYFLLGCLICFLIILFYVAPQIVGFKPVPPPPPTPAASFPIWFWPGVVGMFIFWFIMWFKPAFLGNLLHFTFVPLWWFFILALDGLVYRRAGGKSLIATKPKTMALVAFWSIAGWFVFEYFNYFILSNWYYPYNTIFSTFGYLVWFSLAYTTVWPSMFEWYNLLFTFPSLKVRFVDGDKFILNNLLMWVTLGAGAILLICIGLFPYLVFWGTWVGPMFMLWAGLHLLGLWTPYEPMTKGNWGPMLIMALGTFFNGLFWEGWNFLSNQFVLGVNPNFWKYEIPFVDIGIYYGEMPIMGMFGYLPFGILCWLLWLAIAYLFDLDPDFGLGLDK